jgi:hypothetical protein
MVEAGGQFFHGFRHGLDYAFIRTLAPTDAGRVIRFTATNQILVPAPGD